MKIRMYLAICRNYYYDNLDSYYVITAPMRNKKSMIEYAISIRLEPMKIIRLKDSKEEMLFSTYSPLNMLNPLRNKI